MCRTIMSSRLWYAVALAMALGCIPGVVQAQVGNPRDRDQPPRPIEELAAEFARDPGYPIHHFFGPCPEEGTWQRDLLRLLLEHPINSRQAEALIIAFSYYVQNCDIPELDAWGREAVVSTPSNYSARLVASALWQSGRDDNRSAVLSALFDPEIDASLREAMGDQLAGIPPLGIGPAAALQAFSEGYERVPQKRRSLTIRGCRPEDVAAVRGPRS